jgi:23S rRNA pseudouridine2605 synthase
MEQVRIQKYLAVAGIASRRKAEELIKDGRVSVNGARVTDMGIKVTPADTVEVNGKKVFLEENKVYVMLNKPVGYVTTVKDQFGRPTVVDLIRDIKERIYPVGRLDYDTSGLLLLTNDGDFTFKLTHPKHEMNKTYIAEVVGVPDAADLNRIRNGIKIEDYVTATAEMEVLKTTKSIYGKKQEHTSFIRITIHEGKNRQVRKMCEAIGHPVITLKREAIGKVQLGNLGEGAWRNLSEEEIRWLS